MIESSARTAWTYFPICIPTPFISSYIWEKYNKLEIMQVITQNMEPVLQFYGFKATTAEDDIIIGTQKKTKRKTKEKRTSTKSYPISRKRRYIMEFKIKERNKNEENQIKEYLQGRTFTTEKKI